MKKRENKILGKLWLILGLVMFILAALIIPVFFKKFASVPNFPLILRLVYGLPFFLFGAFLGILIRSFVNWRTMKYKLRTWVAFAFFLGLLDMALFIYHNLSLSLEYPTTLSAFLSIFFMGGWGMIIYGWIITPLTYSLLATILFYISKKKRRRS